MPTKVLNQAVKRNAGRFPEDFMFQLTPQEAESMRSQIVTAYRRNVRFAPYAFTEHGAVMAASILNTVEAVKASVFVVRAFVALREIFTGQKQLAAKLNELEARLDGHDQSLHEIVAAIRELAEPLKARRTRRMGFRPRAAKGSKR